MIISYVKGIMPSLIGKEKDIAKYIITDSEKIINYTISDFSRKVNTSESTVYRFIRKLGFEGYHEFKIKLTQEITKMKGFKSSVIFPEYINDVVNLNTGLINSTLELIDFDQINSVVDIIYNSENIYFLGVGSSSIVCEYGYEKLNVLGKKSFYHRDIHTFNSIIPSIGKNDVIIVVSHSGVTEDIITLAGAVKKEGNTIISITSGIKSPLADISDYILNTANVFSENKIEFLSTRISEIMVIEIIVNGYYKKMEKENPDELIRIKDKINTKRLS
ncbi:MAG TPA: MurR/RpiR family transcriptional regulator [Tepiditoga sp.]|nr:MurR/RpiR family transcriptional regulator [Tepiditoga sp.]